MILFRNNEIKKLFLVLFFVVISLTIISFFYSNKIINDFKKTTYNNNAKIIKTIVDKYPNSETDIMQIIINNEYNGSTEGYKLLDKYGINNSQKVSSVAYLNTLNKNLIYSNFAFLILVLFCIGMVVMLFIMNIYKRINNINTYTVNSLTKNCPIDIVDSSEGDINLLRNNIYKIMTTLKEQRQLLINDKVYLKDTLSDISHQLKTPLTSLIIINDLLYQDLNETDKKEFLDRSHQNLERIEWLITSLLKLSQLDSKTIELQKNEINVAKLISAACEPLLIPIELKNQELVVEGDNDITFIGDFNWTKEAVSNIIKNSTEHTKEYGKININWSTNPIYTEITIKDNGEGIPKKDLPYIFNRFYKAKNSSKASIGIGLAMTKNVISNQNGDVTVKSKQGDYTIFSIKIYKNNI